MSLLGEFEKWRFRTHSRQGYAVKFSPFMPNWIACAVVENYGIKGNGYICLLEVNISGDVKLVVEFKWQDCIFDLSWSEQDDENIVACSGDGTLQLWGFRSVGTPKCIYRGHTKEVYSVEWNPTRSFQGFLSASWDGTVKLWDCHRNSPLSTFISHNSLVNYVTWSPLAASFFSSVGGDACIRVWDIRLPQKPSFQIPTFTKEILSCDWCKYNENLLAIGSTDASVGLWDLRNCSRPLNSLRAHEYAVRRVKFSPFHENILASCSYDCTTRIWTLDNSSPSFDSFDCEIFNLHKEFVYGLDFNILKPGEVVDCSWDGCVQIYHPQSVLRAATSTNFTENEKVVRVEKL